MISRSASAMLQQLAAEGVAPWLSADTATDFSIDLLSHLARHDFVAGAVLTESGSALLHRACDALLPVFLASQGQSGHVSAPITDRDASAGELLDGARALHRRIDRGNLLVRLPATPAGLTATRDCLAQGIGVHVGPVRSPGRYERLLDAFFAGLERALAAGLPLQDITLAADVPVGPLDAEVDARLDALGDPAATTARHTAAVAVARCMYSLREDRLGSDWWRVIRSGGAQLPLLIWTRPASRHAAALVGANTAHALTAADLERLARDVEWEGEALMGLAAEGHSALKELAALGIDIDAPTEHGGGGANG